MKFFVNLTALYFNVKKKNTKLHFIENLINVNTKKQFKELYKKGKILLKPQMFSAKVEYEEKEKYILVKTAKKKKITTLAKT